PRDGGWGTMTVGESCQLGSRFGVGAHTLDHTALDRAADGEALRQLSGSRAWIEDVTGKPCRVFCFPAGKYRRAQLPLVRGAGYLSARTIEFLSTDLPRRVEGLALIPTTVQPTLTRPSPMPGMPSSGGPWLTCFGRGLCCW